MSSSHLARHGLFSLLLLGALGYVVGSQWRLWLDLHYAILVGWLLVCLLTGISAHAAVAIRLPQQIILRLLGGEKPLRTFRHHRQGKLEGFRRLLLRWGGCPKCVAWWSGLAISFALHATYWPRWYAGLFFMVTGASISAVVAIAAFLIDETG